MFSDMFSTVYSLYIHCPKITPSVSNFSLPLQEIRKIRLTDIIYLEVLDHDMRFVLPSESITCRITMKQLDESLRGRGFFRCHKGFTVSFDHVRLVAASGIIMDNGDEVPLSKHRRKEFLEAYASFIGGGVL